MASILVIGAVYVGTMVGWEGIVGLTLKDLCSTAHIIGVPGVSEHELSVREAVLARECGLSVEEVSLLDGEGLIDWDEISDGSDRIDNLGCDGIGCDGCEECI